MQCKAKPDPQTLLEIKVLSRARTFMRYGFEVSKICEKTKTSHCPTAKEAGHLTSKKYGFDASKNL